MTTKRVLWALGLWSLGAVLAALLLCSCGLAPEQADAMRQAVEEGFRQGTYTQAERDILLQTIDQKGEFDWTSLGVGAVNLVAAFFGVPALIRWQRGAPTQKVGLPAVQVEALARQIEKKAE